MNRAVCFLVALPSLLAGPTVAQTTKPADVTAQVTSARFHRETAELRSSFKNRFYGDSSGTQIQLMVTTPDDLVMPQRDAIAIDTFVDDTYQSLLGTNRDGYQSSQSPIVSDDGRSVLFSIAANRPVAATATRAFVRGTIHARAARGKLQVVTGNLALKVGSSTQIGDHAVTLKALSEGTASKLSLTLSVSGDTSLIRKWRVLAKNQSVLTAPEDIRPSGSSFNGRDTSVFITVPGGHDEVTLELTRCERLEDIQIPFEAQIDVGAVKAGPIKAAEPKRGEAGEQPESRTKAWPPPPQSRAQLPEPRTPFDPKPPQAGEPQGNLAPPAVDLFSIAVAKPGPEEVKGVKWNARPADVFRASAFTVVRLMVTFADAAILGVPAGGLKVTSFQDDRGQPLDTSLYGTGSGSPDLPVFLTPDLRQGLLTFSLAAAPTSGATRCTIKGTFDARVARGLILSTSDAVVPAARAGTRCGPYTVDITSVRTTPALAPGYTSQLTEMGIVLKGGPIKSVRRLDVLDAAGKPIQSRAFLSTEGRDSDIVSFSLTLPENLPETIRFRLQHHDREETITVPFSIDTGVGL